MSQEAPRPAQLFLRADLSMLVITPGAPAIELQLTDTTAADLATDLVYRLLSRHPHIGRPLANQLWRLVTAHLSDEQLVQVVESQPSNPPPEVSPNAH